MPLYNQLKALNNVVGIKRARVVVPSDSTSLLLGGEVPCGIWVGVAGNINMLLEEDTNPVLFTAVPVGWMDVHPIRIYATSTTATTMVVGYNT